MRFGASDPFETWQDRLLREPSIAESDFEMLSDAAWNAMAEHPSVQFGQWPKSQSIYFDRERSD